MPLKSTCLVLLAALCLAGCANLRPRTELPGPVLSALDRAGLPPAALGVVAFPLAQRERGLRSNPAQAMQPASTLKLLTTVVALDRLGANARGRTDLLADAAQLGDVLPGPLYLRGGGDTDLDWGALNTLLRSLRDQGVREIQGGLVVDRSLFRPARLDLGEPPFDEAPEFQYNVIPDALQLNTNLLGYVIESDGTQISARADPAWPGILLDTSALTLSDKACADWDEDWQIPQVRPQSQQAAPSQADGALTVRLQGAFPRHCRQQPQLNLLDRQWLTARAVRQIWRELGGVIGPGEREAATPAAARVLASHFGRPLGEVLRGMMKRSDNPLTRLVYLRLGAAAAALPAAPDEVTLAASDRVVRQWLAERHIDATGLVLENGSGLSRLERITPAQLAAVLATAWDGRQAPELLNTLPVAGVDGTLSRRLKTLVPGQARLKTGTLRDVVAIAGYVYDAQQRPWVLVALLNHPQALAQGRPALDALVEWVAGQR
jgi:D-alanyl-D-alanine carboxypeptidase/D-alanyl-D-alanine-endopeptidase (penicillin-binding protein 4)